MTHRSAVALVLTTVTIWGTTFSLLKRVTTEMEPAALIGVRFLLAALVLLPFARGVNKQLLKHGVGLGALLFISFLTQVIGIQTSTANKSAFIVSLNVVMVPLLGPLVRRPAPRTALLAAMLAVAGVWLMSGEVGAFVIGDAWTLLSAFCFAVYIIGLELYAAKHSALTLTAVQVCTVATLALLWSVPNVMASGLPIESIKRFWPVLAYLGIVATAVATLFQTTAQRLLKGFEAALIYALEPVFASFFAFLLLRETLGVRGFIGAAMIVGATIWSQISAEAHPAGEVGV